MREIISSGEGIVLRTLSHRCPSTWVKVASSVVAGILWYLVVCGYNMFNEANRAVRTRLESNHPFSSLGEEPLERSFSASLKPSEMSRKSTSANGSP
jgi:hypothetical protein